MDKEISVKVTRLRHSLIAETEEVKSPSTQSTPKKRGGKLATKPQLELIHENATTEENEPKKRRRSTARLAEVDEKLLTPSRRSTRIRSNTSNISETPTEPEDKGTPSRRSTRIRSNTSLIAETVQYEHSPRAQRAARRTSLAGSDTESTITPVKQTRRARRDSTSSIDKKAESNVSKLGIQPNLVIIEEKLDKNDDETKIKEEISKDINESPSIRRSPRLVEKSGKKSLSQDGHNKENEPDSVKTDDSSKSDLKNDNLEKSVDTEQKVDHEINNPSKSSSIPSDDLEIKSKKKNGALNNSTSAIDKAVSNPKRQRTKSWTTIPSSHSNDHSFLSDTEVMKQKTEKKRNMSITSGSGDGFLNTSDSKVDKENSLNLSISSKKSKISITSSNTDIVNHVNTTSELNVSSRQMSSKQLDPVILGNSPKCLVKSIVFIEDTDSNASTTDKANVNCEANTEDQCVPVVKHDLVAAETQNNLSYEPMDIDETITENTSAIFVNNPVENNSVLLNNSKKIPNEGMTSDFNESVNKSKRKSSVPNIEDVKTYTNTNEPKNSSNSIIVMDNDDVSNISSNMDGDQNMNTSNSNKMLPTLNQDHDNSAKVIKSNRKSSISDTSTDDNKVKNSSIFSSDHVKSNKFKEGYIYDNRDIININPESINRSKRISFSTADDVSKSKDNSETVIEDRVNISPNNCNIMSSHEDLPINTANDMNNGKSSSVAEIESSNKSLKKDKRKSIISNKDNDTTHESVNKSSRKSSISHGESQSLDKSNNENKSTLILSQIKDTSETNIEINEPLSKSLDIPNIKTDIGKKNLSFAYSTSTPLQQKSLKNLGMQLNTSDINSCNDLRKNKTEQKDMAIKKNKKSIVLQNHDEPQSSEEDEEEENTNKDIDEEEYSDKEQNNMFFDTEAKEANKDYESGDSRDDDEKEYEEQNAIVDKGESLDSDEEDFSDDSEYEKDSFVVDSDEEDNNLLSGSGDDLDISDDELNMSAKSKKKFNARKIKEQKEASREMFNARHEQDESNSKSNKQKPKKVNRQRLDSSDSGDEKENTPKSKKSRRARIDSSQDISRNESDASNSMFVKKKKTKRLSESVCGDENEISINQSMNTENIDPLSLQNVKHEPKTPQKDLDISTVVIKNAEEFENVEIDENVSVNKTKLNLSSDPLQNTMAQDDATDSDISISENEEISKNYDSLLNNLNTIKVKTADMSLNLHKKAKLKSTEPIIYELNLTQVKTKKTKTKPSDDQVDLQNVSKDTSKAKALDNLTNQDEDSSDSIDMKLLFNEDSSDSENKTVEEVPDIHIPLKRTEGKMNILESGEETVSFFIDTKGSHTDDKEENVQNSFMNTSSKKKKKTSISLVDNEEVKAEEPEVASVSNKKKKKKLSVSFDQETEEPELKISVTDSHKKKNKKISITLDEQEAGEQFVNDGVSGSNKKKKKKLSLSLNEQETYEQVVNDGVSNSNKKKKKKLSLSLNEQETGEQFIVNAPVNSSKKKKHKTASEEIVQVANEIEGEQIIVNAPVSSSKKKKHKTTSEEIVEVANEIEDNEMVIDEEVKTKKRKRKRSANQSTGPETLPNTDTLTNEPVIVSNDKKKPKLMHEEGNIDSTSQVLEVQEDDHTKQSDKKKKTKSDVDQLVTVNTKKNKKRKHSDLDDNASKDDKQEFGDKALVPRLPTKIIKQLSDKPKKDLSKATFISTTAFKVEKTEKKRMKPSNYLEQSVYLNNSVEEESKKSSLLLPKVWPSVPAVSLSNQGFTTKFKVDVIPRDTKFVFVAQSNDITNFKQDFLQKNRINKLGTMEMYKRRRNIKLSKF